MRLEDIGAEYGGAVLGDERRSKRLVRIGRELACNPGLSFPEAMETEGQLEGLYRFLNNDEVTFEAVHAPHAEQTRLRCQAHDRVLVLRVGSRRARGRSRRPGAHITVLGRLTSRRSPTTLTDSKAHLGPPGAPARRTAVRSPSRCQASPSSSWQSGSSS